MFSSKNISKNIIVKIFNDYLHFKEIISFRLLNKELNIILQDKLIWQIINLTDVGTVDKKEIYMNLEKDNSYIYFLSGKKRDDCFLCIPNGLKKNLLNTKLLII